MNTLSIILVVAFTILFAMNMKVFFFQRTLRKVHLKTGLSMNDLSITYPSSYTIMLLISFLRWGVIIALFFSNWILAVVCIVINFILPAILPEQDDYKNILMARKVINKKKFGTSLGELSFIDSQLKEIQEEMEGMEQKNNTNPIKWEHKYDVGFSFPLHMEDGYECLGKIVGIDNNQKSYIVLFEEAVSIMPVEEPSDGWKDNDFPKKELNLTEDTINGIIKGQFEGTTLHYHF